MSFITTKFSYFARNGLTQNITAMYFVQGARYLIPLITIPYLARVLGVSSWGNLAFIQAFALYLCIIVDYGFELSATREIAENKDKPEKMAHTLANVLAAKFILSVAVILIAGILLQLFNGFDVAPILFWMGIYWALENTFNLFWFFQGIEEVPLLAALDVISKVFGICAIIWFVNESGDEWIVLATYGVSSTIVFFVSLFLAVNKVGLAIPTMQSAILMCKSGWDTFIVRLCSGVYTSASPFVLGLFVTPELVGPYSAAEKVARTSKELMRPITRTLYPRFSILLKSNPLQARVQFRFAGLLLTVFGTLLSGLVYGLADGAVTLIFGSGYAAAVPILELLSWTIVLSIISNVLAIQWLLPNGYDKQVKVISLVALSFFVFLGLFLVPIYGGAGMAAVIIFTEISMIGMCAFAIKKRSLVSLI